MQRMNKPVEIDCSSCSKTLNIISDRMLLTVQFYLAHQHTLTTIESNFMTFSLLYSRHILHIFQITSKTESNNTNGPMQRNPQQLDWCMYACILFSILLFEHYYFSLKHLVSVMWMLKREKKFYAFFYERTNSVCSMLIHCWEYFESTHERCVRWP